MLRLEGDNNQPAKGPEASKGAVLVVCPDCGKETATSFMAELQDKKDKTKSRRVCMVCLNRQQEPQAGAAEVVEVKEEPSAASEALLPLPLPLLPLPPQPSEEPETKKLGRTQKLMVLATVILVLAGVTVRLLNKDSKTDEQNLDQTAHVSADQPSASPQEAPAPEPKRADTKPAAEVAKPAETHQPTPRELRVAAIAAAARNGASAPTQTKSKPALSGPDVLDKLITEATDAPKPNAGTPGGKVTPSKGDIVISGGGKKPLAPAPVTPTSKGGTTASGKPVQSNLSLDQPLVVKNAGGNSKAAPAPTVFNKAGPAPGAGAKTQETLSGFLYFEADSAQFSGAGDELAEVIGVLRRNPDAPVFIQGYTDPSEKGGAALSKQRADAVSAMLSRKMGINVRNVTAVGGPPLPAGDNTPDSRAQNRRVTVSVPNITETKRF